MPPVLLILFNLEILKYNPFVLLNLKLGDFIFVITCAYSWSINYIRASSHVSCYLNLTALFSAV